MSLKIQLCRANKKCEADILISKSSVSTSTKRIKTPLALSWAHTIHKLQGLSLNKPVTFHLQNQIYFGSGEMHTALSRATYYDTHFCKGALNTSLMRVNTSALEEYKRLRQNNIFDNIEKGAIS